MTREQFMTHLQKITPETSEAFKHLLENENNVLHSAGNSECIRILTNRWNTLIELITNDKPVFDKTEETKLDFVEPVFDKTEETKLDFVEPEHRSDV